LRAPPSSALLPYTTLFRSPDYLRVVVRAVPRRGEELPTTSLGVRGQSIGPHEAETIELGGVLNDIPAQLDAVGSGDDRAERWRLDRKSTRLNSSHVKISYA